MSADNGKLLCSSTSFALLYKASSGKLIYGIDIREYEAQISRYDLLRGTLPTRWMPAGSTAYDARNWIVSEASASTVNWNGWPNTTTDVCVSKFFYGMSSRYDSDTGDWLYGAEGMYGIKFYKCTFRTANPMKITKATINVSTTRASGEKIPIDIAFNFSSTQNLTAAQILNLPAYTLYGGSGTVDIGLDIPAGETVVYAYLLAHSFDMARPESGSASSSIRGLTNPSLTRLYYTAGAAQRVAEALDVGGIFLADTLNRGFEAYPKNDPAINGRDGSELESVLHEEYAFVEEANWRSYRFTEEKDKNGLKVAELERYCRGTLFGRPEEEYCFVPTAFNEDDPAWTIWKFSKELPEVVNLGHKVVFAWKDTVPGTAHILTEKRGGFKFG